MWVEVLSFSDPSRGQLHRPSFIDAVGGKKSQRNGPREKIFFMQGDFRLAMLNGEETYGCFRK